MSTEKRSSIPARNAESGCMVANAPKWKRYLYRLVASIATLFTILGISVVALLDHFDGGRAIYLPDDNYSVRGLSEPTAQSLIFKNADSRDILLLYLKMRTSRDLEDRQATESYFRQILKREDDISSAETQSHLLTVHGETCLYHGDFVQAAEYFAQARELWPDNPWAAIRLYKATKEQVRAFLERETWSQEEQNELRRLLQQLQNLEEELTELETVRRVALYQRLDSGGESVVLADLAADVDRISDPVRFPSAPTGVFRDLDLRNPDLRRISDPVFLWSRWPDLARSIVWDAQAAGINYDGNGTATISVIATDPDGIGFKVLGDDSGGTDGTARILAVGIDRYPDDPRFDPLTFAASDARRVARAFAELRYEPEVIIDVDATRERILTALAREVLASRPDDDFVFYFSGHGFTDRAGNRTLVTRGTTAVEVLALAEVEAFLSHHRGRVTMVIDGCLDRRDLELDVTIPDVLFGRNRPAVLVAGAPGDVAIESHELGAGVFSYTLVEYLERLNGVMCNVDCRADLAPAELLRHTSAATRRLAAELHGVEQTPQLLVHPGS